MPSGALAHDGLDYTLTLQKSPHSISLPGVGWVPDPPAKNGEGEAVS